MLTRGAEVWMPTAAEQDARWVEVFGGTSRQPSGALVAQSL